MQKLLSKRTILNSAKVITQATTRIRKTGSVFQGPTSTQLMFKTQSGQIVPITRWEFFKAALLHYYQSVATLRLPHKLFAPLLTEIPPTLIIYNTWLPFGNKNLCVTFRTHMVAQKPKLLRASGML